MEKTKSWYIYRRIIAKKPIVEIKKEKRMNLPWLFGWKLFNVVELTLIKNEKKQKPER